MTKANLILPNGTKVTIEGTSEEVALLLSRIPQAPNVTKLPKSQGPIGNKQSSRQANKSGPQSLIAELAEEGYFKSRRTMADIQMKLEEQGHIYAQPSLSAPLLRLTKKKTLRRIKGKKGWVYVI